MARPQETDSVFGEKKALVPVFGAIFPLFFSFASFLKMSHWGSPGGDQGDRGRSRRDPGETRKRPGGDSGETQGKPGRDPGRLGESWGRPGGDLGETT